MKMQLKLIKKCPRVDLLSAWKRKSQSSTHVLKERKINSPQEQTELTLAC